MIYKGMFKVDDATVSIIDSKGLRLEWTFKTHQEALTFADYLFLSWGYTENE